MITASEAYVKSYDIFKTSHAGQTWANIEETINKACENGKFTTTVSVPQDYYKDVMRELGHYCTYGQGYLDKMDRIVSITIEWKHLHS